MALSIIFAREGFGTKRARMLFGFIMCCQMALHVFLIAETLLARRAFVGVHPGMILIVGLSVTPAALLVRSHLWNSWSAYLTPVAEERVLLQVEHTWRLVKPASLDGPALTLTTDEDPDPLEAVDLDSLCGLWTLRFADRTDLVVNVGVITWSRTSPACVMSCESCDVGERYCCILSLQDHTLGGCDEMGALSTV